MRTMASVWFSVIVLITINDVFGNICSKDLGTMNCNECLRCGANWCNKPGIGCGYQEDHDWCAGEREPLPRNPNVDKVGADIQPIYAERSLAIGKPTTLDIHYTIGKVEPIINIANTTQSQNIDIVARATKCDKTGCVSQIEATAKQDFCNTWGGVQEFVYAEIFIGNVTAVVRYHVPCACECSLESNVEKNSPKCNMHGDYSCGRCECHSEWKGEHCEITNCPVKRGDVQCMDSSRMDVDCFGNGYCGVCDTCICYSDRVGSQYFDKDDYCSDLCTITSECEDCLQNSTMGLCDRCIHDIHITPFNETARTERDLQNRLVWMKCNLTLPDCSIDYMAMRDEQEKITVMIVSSCNDMVAGAIGATGSKAPIIVGVVLLLAVVAAVAGAMLWKHMNATPKLPLNDSQYQNIDPEDCQYQNPLYVPPTTNFNNPMYGKSQ